MGEHRVNTLVFIYQHPDEDLQGEDVGNHILRLKYLLRKLHYENGAYATEQKLNQNRNISNSHQPGTRIV